MVLIYIFVYLSNFGSMVTSQDCYVLNTNTYNGTQNITESGRSCIRWDSELLSANATFEDWMFPYDGSVAGAGDYCRDPFFEGNLWCFTTNPDVIAEVCGIQECEEYSANRLGSQWAFFIPFEDDIWRCRLATDSNNCTAGEVFACLGEFYTISFTVNELCYEYLCCLKKGCFDLSSTLYAGEWSHTGLGEECLAWNIVEIFRANSTFDINQFPEKTLSEANNYCRDPFNQGALFCFKAIDNFGGTQLDSCDIPECSELASRHMFDHDCYTPTEQDQLHPDLPDEPTYQQLCELQSNRFYIETPSDDYPGCKGCSCCQYKECHLGLSDHYNGTWSRSASGRVCARWDEQPSSLIPQDVENENYCRDFSYFGLTWCYTNDPNAVFDYCDLTSTCDRNITINDGLWGRYWSTGDTNNWPSGGEIPTITPSGVDLDRLDKNGMTEASISTLELANTEESSTMPLIDPQTSGTDKGKLSLPTISPNSSKPYAIDTDIPDITDIITEASITDSAFSKACSKENATFDIIFLCCLFFIY